MPRMYFPCARMARSMLYPPIPDVFIHFETAFHKPVVHFFDKGRIVRRSRGGLRSHVAERQKDFVRHGLSARADRLRVFEVFLEDLRPLALQVAYVEIGTRNRGYDINFFLCAGDRHVETVFPAALVEPPEISDTLPCSFFA